MEIVQIEIIPVRCRPRVGIHLASFVTILGDVFDRTHGGLFRLDMPGVRAAGMKETFARGALTGLDLSLTRESLRKGNPALPRIIQVK